MTCMCEGEAAKMYGPEMGAVMHDCVLPVLCAFSHHGPPLDSTRRDQSYMDALHMIIYIEL